MNAGVTIISMVSRYFGDPLFWGPPRENGDPGSPGPHSTGRLGTPRENSNQLKISESQ